jgi:protocatechuate 3,4-dioxygenase beta subunit
MTMDMKTDAKGQVHFKDIPPGNYTVTAKYDNKHPLVEQVRSHVGETT